MHCIANIIVQFTIVTNIPKEDRSFNYYLNGIIFSIIYGILLFISLIRFIIGVRKDGMINKLRKPLKKEEDETYDEPFYNYENKILTYIDKHPCYNEVEVDKHLIKQKQAQTIKKKKRENDEDDIQDNTVNLTDNNQFNEEGECYTEELYIEQQYRIQEQQEQEKEQEEQEQIQEQVQYNEEEEELLDVKGEDDDKELEMTTYRYDPVSVRDKKIKKQASIPALLVNSSPQSTDINIQIPNSNTQIQQQRDKKYVFGTLFQTIGYNRLSTNHQTEQYIPHPNYHRTPFFTHNKDPNTISNVIKDGRSTFRQVSEEIQDTTFELETFHVLDASSNFHGLTFPQFEFPHTLRVNKSRNPCFADQQLYKCQNIKKELNTQLLRPYDIQNGNQYKLAIFGNSDWKCIKQGSVQDSQFVSALIGMRFMEDKIQMPLIKDKLYPQDDTENALYNPNGQYHLRMFINGSWRVSEIDDLLPCLPQSAWQEQTDQPHTIAVAHIINSGELWVSLIEKAYLQAVSNGYDTKGVSGSEAIYSLSKWIPDQTWNLPLVFQSDREFQKL
ncbi:MAG: hypothetical protein EZS28_036373, partial [Streblomastix strix]